MAFPYPFTLGWFLGVLYGWAVTKFVLERK